MLSVYSTLQNDYEAEKCTVCETPNPLRNQKCQYCSTVNVLSASVCTKCNQSFVLDTVKYSNDKGHAKFKSVVGLKNLGNSCFLNSTLQCLIGIKPLKEYYLKLKSDIFEKDSISYSFVDLLHEINSNKYVNIAPVNIKNSIIATEAKNNSDFEFFGTGQMDANELLSFFLEKLSHDIEKLNKNKNNKKNIINDLFTGQYKQKIKCNDCDYISSQTNDYTVLNLNIPSVTNKEIEYTFCPLYDWNKTQQTDLLLCHGYFNGIAKNCCVSLYPKTIIKIIFDFYYIVNSPTVYGITMKKMDDILTFKEKLSKIHNVPRNQLFVCDIWKSKIHRELKNHDIVGDINRKSDDIFVYYCPLPIVDQLPKIEKNNTEKDTKNKNNNNSYGNYGYGYYKSHEFGNETQLKHNTFVITHQKKIKSKYNHYYNSNNGERYEDEPLGLPLLITLPTDRIITIKQLRIRIWNKIFPFIKLRGQIKNDKQPIKKKRVKKEKSNQFYTEYPISNHPIEDEEAIDLEFLVQMDLDSEKTTRKEKLKAYSCSDNDLPFRIFACWGFNNNLELIYNSNDEFDLNKRSLKFIIHWTNYVEYRYSFYHVSSRIRDSSAPQPLNNSDGISYYTYGYKSRQHKTIKLDQCLDNTLNEEDIWDKNEVGWSCPKCKCKADATKSIKISKLPQFIFLNIKRFTYTRNYRDRIDAPISFPLKNLDMGKYLHVSNNNDEIKEDENVKSVNYNLCGVINHIGGMGVCFFVLYFYILQIEH